MTNQSVVSAPAGACFFSYNSADEAVTRLIENAVARLERVQLDVWEFTQDANLGKRKWDSMHESISEASSVAIFVGPNGLGRIQNAQELDWAMDVETDGAHIFIVLLPEVSPQAIPARLGNPAQIPLSTEDVAEGHLTDTGFEKLCGGILARTRAQAAEWLKDRERELFLSPPRRARALLVGVGDYEDDDLANLSEPGRDIEELETTLASLRLHGGVAWEVKRLPEVSRDQLLTALRAFFLDEADRDDFLLFYFSGHGTTDSGSSYFLPRDGFAHMPETTGAVRADTVRTFLRDTPAWASVVILDCCHGDSSGPDASTYESLPERSAVLGASAGPTAASGDDGLSPFTSALISILREQDPLPLAHLEERLRAYHSTAWAQVGTLGSVERVTLGRTTEPRAQEPRRFTERVVVGSSLADTGRLQLLRRLAHTLDALLATTSERGPQLEAVIRESFDVIVEEMRQLVSRHEEHVSWTDLNQMDPRPLVEVAFADRDQESFASLPWEYLGVLIGGKLDWAVPARICRVVPVAATKSAPVGKLQSPLVLSAPPPEWGTGLSELTEREMESSWTGRFVGGSRWGELTKSKPDLLAIQCALSPSGELHMGAGNVNISFLKAVVERLPIRILVLETVAAGQNPCAGVSLRQTAYALAQATSRSVIAVCHQMGYANQLNEVVKLPGAEETSGPRYSFVASLVSSLTTGEKLEDAAYTARERVVVELGPEAGPYVGIPVTVRAEPQQAANVQRSGPARSRQPNRTGDASLPDSPSEFMP